MATSHVRRVPCRSDSESEDPTGTLRYRTGSRMKRPQIDAASAPSAEERTTGAESSPSPEAPVKVEQVAPNRHATYLSLLVGKDHCHTVKLGTASQPRIVNQTNGIWFWRDFFGSRGARARARDCHETRARRRRWFFDFLSFCSATSSNEFRRAWDGMDGLARA